MQKTIAINLTATKRIAAMYKKLTASTNVFASGLEHAGTGIAERLGKLPMCAVLYAENPYRKALPQSTNHILTKLRWLAADKAGLLLSPMPTSDLRAKVDRKNFAWACSMGDALLSNDPSTLRVDFSNGADSMTWESEGMDSKGLLEERAHGNVMNLVQSAP